MCHTQWVWAFPPRSCPISTAFSVTTRRSCSKTSVLSNCLGSWRCLPSFQTCPLFGSAEQLCSESPILNLNHWLATKFNAVHQPASVLHARDAVQPCAFRNMVPLFFLLGRWKGYAIILTCTDFIVLAHILTAISNINLLTAHTLRHTMQVTQLQDIPWPLKNSVLPDVSHPGNVSLPTKTVSLINSL